MNHNVKESASLQKDMSPERETAGKTVGRKGSISGFAGRASWGKARKERMDLYFLF